MRSCPQVASRIVVVRSKSEMRVAKRSIAAIFLGSIPHYTKIGEFQTPATPIMEGIVDLHNYIMFFLVLVVFFVLYMLFATFVQFSQAKFSKTGRYGYTGDNKIHDSKIEIV